MLLHYKTISLRRKVCLSSADQKSSALSVHLNIAEGCSRKSENERKRFFEVSRGSVIEVDAALDISEDLSYCKKEDLKELGLSMVRTFSMLSKMIGN